MRLGGYEVLSELGRGATAVVSRARSPGGRVVAVKLLLRSTPDAFARFERERRILASLGAGEGFVPLLDAGLAPEGPFVVMPLVSGGTLRDRLERGPLGLDDSLALARSLARALGRAHALGIVHRDLKPENILLTGAGDVLAADGTRDPASPGQPLVADLGLAKHFDRSAASQSVSLSREGDLRGTAGYMAPEQMRDAKSAGPPADVFALGAILHECLAGQPAFLGATPLELIAKVDRGETVPLRRLREDVPPWLERVVARALAASPASRFEDGAALAAALEPPPRSERRPLVVLGALGSGAVLLAAGVTAGSWLRGAGSARPARVSPAPVPTSRAPSSPVPANPAPATPASPQSPAALERHAEALALANRAAALDRAGDSVGALAAASRAIELDPRPALAWGVRGLCRLKANDLDRAIADFTEALDRDPKDTFSLVNRSTAHLRRGDHEDALADMTRALHVAPARADLWSGRGQVRTNKGDPAGAEADYTQSIELDAGKAETWQHRGAVRMALGKVDEAAADFTRATGIDPGYAVAWLNLAVAELRRNRLDASLAAATRAVELGPDLATAWANRSHVRSVRGDRAGAIDDLSRAIALEPQVGGHWISRGAEKLDVGDVAGGRADLEKGLELAPKDARAEAVRARLAELGGASR